MKKAFKFPTKDNFALRVGTRVWNPINGFGKITQKNVYSLIVAYDKGNEELHTLKNSKKLLFKATDPCIQIFKVKPEVK